MRGRLVETGARRLSIKTARSTRGEGMPRAGGNRTAIIIARLLGVEGYSDFVHNQVIRYWRRVVMDPRRRKSIDGKKAEFSELMKGLTERDRLLVGKFITLNGKMNFDTGLRIGLMAHAHESDKAIYERPGVDVGMARDGHSDPEKAIAGALKSAIVAHGPITVERIPSAVKRVIGSLKVDTTHQDIVEDGVRAAQKRIDDECPF
jgi:hypothetical protein